MNTDYLFRRMSRTASDGSESRDDSRLGRLKPAPRGPSGSGVRWPSCPLGCSEAESDPRGSVLEYSHRISRARFCAAQKLAVIALAAVGLWAADSPRNEGVAAYGDGRYSVALGKLKQAVAADANDQTSRVFLALTQAALNDCTSALPEL